jgi:uncharacterized protein (TIGR00725 family)
MRVQVAVCGPGECTDLEAAQAYEVGELLAARGAVVICGGGAGVMAAVAAGARVRGGITVGIHPATRDAAYGMDADLSVTIATGMGEARNAIIVASADAVIVIGGSWGTLSEVALAKRRGDVAVVALGGWRILDADGGDVGGIQNVATPAEAVAAALAG